jgi:GntR family transcriptional regulator
MQIHLSTSDGVPIYLQIVNQVKYLAACGRLEPGTQLPSVRKLADQLLVNPNTVARAYRELESEGVLTTRPGAGVFVAADGSPLARREQLRIIQDRVDQLLAEASHMKIDVETLVKLLRQRSRLTHALPGESNHE